MKKIITETTKYTDINDYKRYSVSKLKGYKLCSQRYKHIYIDKIGEYSQSDATIIGTLLHAALEYLYDIEDDSVVTAEDAFFKILPDEFSKLSINSPDSMLGDLLDYHDVINKLYKRASASYTGIDAIRTTAGKVPKVPEMTGTWKKEVKALKLNERKELIDYVIKASKGLENVSITNVFTKAYNLACKYKTPSNINKILYLELPLSEWDYKNNKLINAVPFPDCDIKDVYLNGYIDNIAEVEENGKNVLSVIDYKTSKEEFTETIVKHNQQLLLYAKAVEYLLKRPVEYIGILSLTEGKLVNVPLDKEIQNEVVVLYNQMIKDTLESKYRKHVPDSKYATCNSLFGKECDFLNVCWPKTKKPDLQNYLHYLEDDYIKLYN